MTERKTILLTGLLGVLASILVGFGEFLLHYSPQLVDHAENFAFFKYVPKNHLIWGHFLSVIAMPLYFAGYYHIYKMLNKVPNKWASMVFGLGILAFLYGGFWISSRAFLGTIVHLHEELPSTRYQEILDNYTLISESLVQGLRVIILLLSIFFVIAILKSKSYYDKWMILFNPITILITVFIIYFLAPVVGQYIAPIAMNVTHLVLFSISLYQFHKNYPS